jgi:DNA-binding CsgD family transcriptional regulator
MPTVSPERVRSEIATLSHRGLGVRDFSLAAARILRRAVPFDGVCVVTMDPATQLLTGHVIENGLPEALTPRLAQIEVVEADFNKFTELARGNAPAASLSQATAGRLERSIRHRELRRPNGFEDELRAAFADDSGTWGGIVLMHEAGRTHFSTADVQLLAAVTRQLTEGLRRAILASALSADDETLGVGLLLLADDDSIAMANDTARSWLAELRERSSPEPILPFVIHTVADHARNIASGRANGGATAGARIRTRTGRWLLVRGSVLGDGADARTAVMLESAAAPELAPLIADSYGLTARERAVTRLVAHGRSTSEIARLLYLSPYTVQDHLKAVFDKVGVGTRGELVARLFFDHYAPRLASGAPVAPNGWFAPAPAGDGGAAG